MELTTLAHPCWHMEAALLVDCQTRLTVLLILTQHGLDVAAFSASEAYRANMGFCPCETRLAGHLTKQPV